MNQSEQEDFIIEKYKQEEGLMILLFAQWCVNHDLDPIRIYQKAFPSDVNNSQLKEAIELTLPKSESDEVPLSSLIEVLTWFEQDQLAFIITEEAQTLSQP